MTENVVGKQNPSELGPEQDMNVGGPVLRGVEGANRLAEIIFAVLDTGAHAIRKTATIPGAVTTELVRRLFTRSRYETEDGKDYYYPVGSG